MPRPPALTIRPEEARDTIARVVESAFGSPAEARLVGHVLFSPESCARASPDGHDLHVVL